MVGFCWCHSLCSLLFPSPCLMPLGFQTMGSCKCFPLMSSFSSSTFSMLSLTSLQNKDFMYWSFWAFRKTLSNSFNKWKHSLLQSRAGFENTLTLHIRCFQKWVKCKWKYFGNTKFKLSYKRFKAFPWWRKLCVKQDCRI